MNAIRMERILMPEWESREWHPVGETIEEMAKCMGWIRSLGHEAKSLEEDGFRYRSVYRMGSGDSEWITTYNDEGIQCSHWMWASPGQWLMNMVGHRQDSELDAPHGEGPGDMIGWMQVPIEIEK